MEFDLPRAVGLVLAVVAAGVGGLIAGDVMPLQVTLMMVLPSMLAFAAITFAVGVKHGEYRVT
jgi:ABC-type dipeptide/oligopeptide/nickel transport system permease subunit